MNLVKRILKSFAGVSFRDLAENSAKNMDERANDIAAAFNLSSRNYSSYLHYRDGQITQIFDHIQTILGVAQLFSHLYHDQSDYTKTFMDVRNAGHEAVLQNASRLQITSAELRKREVEAQATLREVLEKHDQLMRTTDMLAAAEKKMPKLTRNDTQRLISAHVALRQNGTQLRTLFADVPEDNKEVEAAVAWARYNVDAEARKADAQAQQSAFNALLQTGMVTDKTVAAPRTARFTRKTKPHHA